MPAERRDSIQYRMRGQDAGGQLITWVASVPDHDGSTSPAPVRPDSIVVLSKFSDGMPWVCLECGGGIGSESAHEENPGACEREKVRQVMES